MDEEKEIEPRYMTQGKKQYYLASVDENMTQLLRGEIDSLTQVLIELKSQYDQLTRESNVKKMQTEELAKKINALKDIDKKAQKQINIAEQRKDDIEGDISQKKITLREAQFQKKTLSNAINKLKQDILLTQKQILVSENKTKRLNKHYERERFKENQLKETKNKVFSKITEQDKKNDFEKNEQNLQLQYYKTIIQQKNMFLKSADERKERQKKIAEEAKNDSADKQEVEKRKELGLLKLYNKFLKTKMEKVLKENEKIEEVYIAIRDICGTNSLKIITERILNKDKKYNENVSKVSQLQNKIEVLELDNALLEKELTALKNYVIVKETDNNKTISTIPTSIIEDDENKLIQEEAELIVKLNQLQDKQENINLIYQKILENIDNLSHAALNSTIDIDTETTRPGITTNQNENTELNLTSSAYVPNESKLTLEKNDNEGEIERENEKEDEKEEEKDIEIDENESDEYIKKYYEFLKLTKKRFEILFLIHNKNEFLNIMAQEGIKKQGEYEFNQKKGGAQPKVFKRSNTRRNTRKRESVVKHKGNVLDQEIEFDNDDVDEENLRKFAQNKPKKNNELSDDIFQRFLEEEQQKTRAFVHQTEKKKF